MKNLHKTIFLSAIICFILASCGNRLTISKRHYKKGYYVSFSKKHGTTSANQQASNKTNSNKKVIPISEKPVQEIVSANQIMATPTQSNVVPPLKKPAKVSTVKEEPKKSFAIFQTMMPKVKINYGYNTLQKQGMSASQEGHSLLWIVVVVLIILWALGIISGSFGLGILINLLLIIALVLLVLWLLRVI